MGNEKVSNKDLTFRTQIGQKATVERQNVSGEGATQANQALMLLGNNCNPLPQNMRYMGSAAVHIFWNETLEIVQFVSQTSPLENQGCPEILASKAFDDLLGTMKQQYGHSRSRLRSGF